MMPINTTQRSTMAGSILRVVLAFGILAGFIACSGEDGLPGQDGISPDITPPAIALLAPAAGDTARDTLRVVASAVDNIAVDRVVFYLDGSDRIDDTTFAEVSGLEAIDNQYVWTFDLLELGLPNGIHSVMARAFDVDRNQTDTPAVFVYSEYQTPPGPAVLRTWEPDSLEFYQFPSMFGVDQIDDYHNSRFLPERDCQIDSVRLYLSGNALADLNFDSPLIIEVFDSDGVFPVDTGNPLGSVVLDVQGMDSTGWFTAIVENLDPLLAGQFFHVSVRPTLVSDITAFAIGVSVMDKYDYPVYNRSSRQIVSSGLWQSLQDEFAGDIDNKTREFMIDVWVTYF
jgi:hypothetical protein